jgi:hypothetical protein
MENDQYLHYEVGKQFRRLFYHFPYMCMYAYAKVGIMYNTCVIHVHVSHIYKVGKSKLGYDFGISNMSKTFF